MRQIKIHFTGNLAMTQHVRFFRDWYEFADYVKQENERFRSVTIWKWEYVSA